MREAGCSSFDVALIKKRRMKATLGGPFYGRTPATLPEPKRRDLNCDLWPMNHAGWFILGEPTSK